MYKSKDRIDISEKEVQQIMGKNKTVYDNLNWKNPFKQNTKEFFHTKVSFKSLNIKISRESLFKSNKRKLEQDREKKIFSQTSKNFNFQKPNNIMNKLFQLHEKLEKSSPIKKFFNEQDVLSIQENFYTKEICIVPDSDKRNIINLKNDLNNSKISNAKSILEDLKLLKENYNLPEIVNPKFKEKVSYPRINFGRRKKENFFLTGNIGQKLNNNYKRDKLLIPDHFNYNKKIYFKPPLFDNKKIITLYPKMKISDLPKIKVNNCHLNPDIISPRSDKYGSLSLKDVLLFEKAIIPRFKY